MAGGEVEHTSREERPPPEVGGLSPEEEGPSPEEEDAMAGGIEHTGSGRFERLGN